jgi:cyclic beta-1,2-glucan synthetase
MAITDDILVSKEELAPHSTVPDIVIPTEGLPEAPSVSEDALRASATALVGKWQALPKGSLSKGLELRLKALTERLKSRLAAAKSIADTKELTPQLELLESGRMFEAAITSASAAKDTLAKLPRVQLPDGAELPRILNLAEGYLSTAKGIWSPASLIAYTDETQRLDPLLLAEVRLLPEALKLAQLEYILDRADETFAGGPIPSIEQSPFSAPIHSLRRLNQFEWRKLLETILAFQTTLSSDPAGVFSSMEDETRS